MNSATTYAGFYLRYGKRTLDLALTIPALILLAPLLLLIALVVRITLGAPVLFRQVRPGLHGKPFTLYKFRTLTDTRDAQGNLLRRLALLDGCPSCSGQKTRIENTFVIGHLFIGRLRLCRVVVK